jgi:cytochrome c peroxidase
MRKPTASMAFLVLSLACQPATNTTTTEEGPFQQATHSSATLDEDARPTGSALVACIKHFRFMLEALAPPAHDASPFVARGRRAFNDRRLHGLGGNGRACADCHMASNHFSLTPALAKARLEAVEGCRELLPWVDDPLFRPIDADDFRANGIDASDYSNLTENGLVRVTIPLPPNVRLLDCGAAVPCPATAQPTAETAADVWRAVPSIRNVALTGPDGRDPSWVRGPNPRGGYQADARIETLQAQALSALVGHAEIQGDPGSTLLDSLASFQNAEFSSRRVAELAVAPDGDPLPPDTELTSLERSGKAVFIRSCRQCHGGPGLSTPAVAPPQFVAGATAMPRYHTIQVDCPRPVDTMSPPRFVFPPCSPSLARNIRTYEFTRADGTTFRRSTSDPGRALLSGFETGNAFASDFQRYDNTSLHGVSHTAPYFHNNSAATLDDVLDLYAEFFKQVRTINPSSFVLSTITPGANDRPFTPEERPALLAFLRRL